tara:strand:- start:660 stop:1307 length:648 start_codon:yes stop_codon:yes gene_type:complete
MAASMFSAPIPGQSLTDKPGERRWERPPDFNTTEEVLQLYLTHLSKADVIDDMMVLLETGFPVKPLVKGMRISNTMNGKHNLDVGLLVEPLLVKFISATAESLDVPYKLGDVDLEQEAAEKENARISMLIDAALSKSDKTAGEDEGVALMQEIANNIDTSKEDVPEEGEAPMDAEAPVEGAPMDEAPMDELEPAEPEMQQEQPATPQGAGLMARG